MLGLVMAMPVVHAEDFDISQIDSNLSAIEDEASEEVLDSSETSDKPMPLVDDEIKKPDPAVDEDSKKTNLDGIETEDASDLELGAENVPEAVRQSTVPAPTINKVFYDATTITGGNVQRKRVTGVGTVRSTVYVTLKDNKGNEKATVSVTPKSGTTWTVNLPAGVTVAAGDTVTAYQTLDGATSSVVTANAEPSIANQTTLTMPTGKICIEQTSSNIVNDDEQAEAIEMLKKANPDIANDFDLKKTKFSIDGTNHAYYEVTYTDGSTSGKIEATGLKIKQVTEYSKGAILNGITVVDNVITGQLAGEGPFENIKVQLVIGVAKADQGSYCEGGKCTIDKDSSKPVEAEVDSTTGKFTYTLKPNEELTFGKVVGVIVKEKNKFKSCRKTTVTYVTPKKTGVKDPKKLTDKDKENIDAAIRAENSVGVVSKLPNGTGDWDGVPAVIQFDDSGNVKIFSGNDVAGTWDPNNDYKFVPETNEDGSYKIKNGAEPKITFPAKDLVKNIAPKSPVIEVDTNTGKVTITPPAYKDPGDDTDLLSYTITYTDDSGAEKTVTATRDLQTNTWSGPGVNEESGVITLSVEKIELAGTIKAIAKDNGGLEGDTDKLDSDPATKKLETATVSYNGNGGTEEMDGKKLNKGSKYKILDNKFKAPENQEFDYWEIDGKKVAAGTEITITKDTVVKAIWKKTQVKVSYNANGGSGEMTGSTQDKGSEYTVLPNAFKAPDDTQEFKAWEVNGKEVAAGTKIKLDKDTEIKALWKKTQVKVTYNANGGKGQMTEKDQDKGSEYAILSNKFEAPDDTQEFKAWEVNGKEVAAGTKIKLDKDTEIKALWKKTQVKV
ncbi:hypothetical protein, partial [Anaerococcus kampingiae]